MGSRPKGGRPPNRRGRGGIGPGPGYRAPGHGKGSTHKPSFGSAPQSVVVLFSVMFIGGPAALVIGVGWFLLHGHGVL